MHDADQLPTRVRDADPLIVTALFDPVSADLLQRLRDRHFPPRLNIVPAHLTLFHHLPGAERHVIDAQLQRLASDAAPMPVQESGVRFLGRGVAIEIRCLPLVALRQRLAATWSPWLSAQDRQGFRPHVTVQNKVTAAEARLLCESLSVAPPPIQGHVTGLALWIYRGGPWETAAVYRFGSPSAEAG